ncbi:MAG: hypothetical protein KF760_20390 [Candidatus Eremiobacteraeota bacterium]|nr:hypothetical protein [Candidatus Eremiobacteraeota bacterium]MCW5871767.1 hypothetical protein [Candidatus Eremiobacteraeota bacterium]
MKLPKGTIFMPEGLLLSAPDLQSMLDNLMQDHFSGYFRVEFPGANKGFVFLSRGQMLRAFEWTPDLIKLYTPERLFAKAGDGAATSSYVLTAEMAEALAASFALESVPAGNWRETIQQGRQTGFVEFAQPFAGTILYHKGEPIQESLTTHYGEVVCGRDGLSKLLNEGRPSLVMAGDPAKIEEKCSKAHKDLDAMREVKLKSVSGFFATKDALKVEADLAAGWGVSSKGFNLVVESLDGEWLGTLKAVTGCKKPGVMEIPLKVMQEWGANEDQDVLVYPE